MDAAEEEEAGREQCRAQLEPGVMTRTKYGFSHVHKPILENAPMRTVAFDAGIPELVASSSKSGG